VNEKEVLLRTESEDALARLEKSEIRAGNLEREVERLEDKIEQLEEKLEGAIPPNLLCEIRVAIRKNDLDWAIELIGREIGY
jgi:predicted RNase H-like nuclease (RuvC/YqgF family)